MLTLDEAAGTLFNAARSECFDAAHHSWTATAATRGVPVSPAAAATWLQRRSGHPLKQPAGVVGPRDASAEQTATAEALGVALGTIGFSVVCGGRAGVMEAVCRGVATAGGISIGLLPEADIGQANPHVTVPIATGIGEARNALIARAAFCLVAVGDSYGTLSEVALGLHFGRPVLGLCGAADVPGVQHVANVDAAIDMVARLALAIR